MRQLQALNIMMSGANVFLTGPPGAGKTYVLNKFINRMANAGKRVAVTASTGIAASHIGGTTIHSWSGLGVLERLTIEDLNRLGGSDKLTSRYISTDTLVIDEISMLHGKRLDMVNQLAKKFRGSDEPFGGMQIVLVGDFFQLPPVNKTDNSFDFVHTSLSWQELNPLVCYLSEQHRQQIDDELLNLLNSMRLGQIDDLHYEMLSRRKLTPPDHQVVTKLYSHNIDVDAINQRQLNLLPGVSHRFKRMTKGSKGKLMQLTNSLLAPETLELKIDAEVMFVTNNFNEGYVNGSQGRVVDFEEGYPVVSLSNGRKITVKPHTWTLTEDGRTRAEISQLPLRLAWAITIHKSQGMSLDSAEIDLSKAFTPGMGYVALSRIRSLDGLYLLGINNMALKMNPEIDLLDSGLKQKSIELSLMTEDIADEVEVVQAEPVIDESLYQKLKSWRTFRASQDKLPPYIIMHDKTLSAVTAASPFTDSELLAVNGFGPKKVADYGPEILTIIAEHNKHKPTGRSLA